MSDTSDCQPKSRTPHCSRCSNHKIKQEMRNHKGKCPFQDCTCPNCEMTKQRQMILNAEIQVYRKRRADLNKKPKSDRKFVKSRKRLSQDEKLTEILFKQIEDKVKNVIRGFVIRSSGNAGLDVENWIKKGLEMSSNSEYFPQTSTNATIQPTIQSSDESSLEVPKTPDSDYIFNQSLQTTENEQNFNFQNEFTMDIDDNFAVNNKFNEQDFQNLISDLKSRLNAAAVDNSKDLTTINQNYFLPETQMQNLSKSWENVQETNHFLDNCHNSNSFSPNNQFCTNQYLVSSSINSDSYSTTNSSIIHQISYQNKEEPNLKIPIPQGSTESICNRNCKDIDTQVELELIEQVLESLSETETFGQRSYTIESELNVIPMSIFD